MPGEVAKSQEVTKSVGGGGSWEVVGVCVELSGESKQNSTTGEIGQVRQALEGRSGECKALHRAAGTTASGGGKGWWRRSLPSNQR